jgi:DNA-binding response OmpR family regulator
MPNILMLEPDAVLAKIYREAFELAGYEVRRSVSAQDAVFLIDEKQPDVILVELQLVAHSGIEFLYELRSYSEWQHIPVLIHSCIPPLEFEDSMQLLRNMLNVKEFLYKPHTSLQTLLREVRDAIATVSDEMKRVDHAALLASLHLKSESV